jgi:hypothetical protein
LARLALLASILAVWASATAAVAAPPRIAVVSSAPTMVSGETALVRITGPMDGQTVRLDGQDVSGDFKPDPNGPGRLGLVAGLKPGANELEIAGKNGGVSRLRLIDHPITGPIVSGPQMRPFICQTDRFLLPDGAPFGPATDVDCSAPTQITYVYMALGASDFKPMPNPAALPADVAKVTTIDGKTVPFVVRVETATINRGIHQNAVLFDPTRELPPTPFTPPRAWNRRLIAVHGTGCPGGWYVQGAAQGDKILDPARLTEGYALFTNTLRHPSNSCNALLAGETTMMDKEHLIKTLGVPAFTVSKGISGGAYTSLQVADAFPGLFDGVMIGATFPDALSIALNGMDAHLLTHFFATHAGFTEAQQVAIGGYKSLAAMADAANQAQRTDPISGRADIAGYKAAVWNPAVPVALRYDPVKAPHGARPTIFDAARNIYGVDPKTGFARRPFDNVGVQYGLAALKAGVITPEQFIALNAQIGGYDQDANYVARRSVGDPVAIRRAQRYGLALSGAGGLASIPVFDTAVGDFHYNEDGGYHYQWYHFAVRERLRQANGDADNEVMWRGATHAGGEAYDKGWRLFIQWVAASTSDPAAISRRAKTLRDRPEDLADGCWTGAPDPRFIAEPQTWGARADSPCNRLYPSYSFARQVAGGPLAADVYKCALKPVRAADYGARLSADQVRRLRAVFPAGVCDFSRPGLDRAELVPRLPPL